MKTFLSLIGLSVLFGVTTMACAGGGGGDAPSSGDEQDLKAASSCAPIVTLTCAQGFESTEQGCAQSHVAGAKPLGRCVSVDVAKLVGTFSNPESEHDDLAFFTITFGADGSYDAVGGCRATSSHGAICGAILKQTGTWSIEKSGPELGAPLGAPEIVLVDSFKQKQVLFYTLAGTKLSLKTALVGDASQFVKE
jgi:hypothetical protein